MLAIDNSSQGGSYQASFFGGNNETMTAVASLRWMRHQLWTRGVALRLDSILGMMR
jgi:hypothetical protein